MERRGIVEIKKVFDLFCETILLICNVSYFLYSIMHTLVRASGVALQSCDLLIFVVFSYDLRTCHAFK